MPDGGTSLPARALVIGGETPIGRATASLLEAGGARVAVQVPGPDADPVAARALVTAACEALGGLDTVIRIEAPAVRGPADAIDPAEWTKATGGVVGGAFNVTVAAAELLAPGGSVVHVLTLDAVHAYPERSALAAATTGTLGVVRALAIELAGRGIRVNAVIAGPIEEAIPAWTESRALERTRHRSPMGRLGRATEIAEAIRFVAGDGASFMTGQSLRVDGGWAALNQAPEGMRFS